MLISRTRTTGMGLEVARCCGVTLIGRAKSERVLAFNGSAQIEFGK